MSNVIAESVERASRYTPTAEAARMWGAEPISYRELDRNANRLAHAMRALGLVPGDRVALWATDSLASLEVFVAVAKLSLIVVPISERLQAPEVSYMFERTSPALVIYSDSVADRLSRVLEGYAGDGLHRWALDGGELAGSSRYADMLSAGSTDRPADLAGAGDRPYMIAFSSGTTGRPKGAVLTASSIREVVSLSARARRLDVSARSLIPTSLSFPATICASIFTSFHVNGAVLLMGRGWDVSDYVHAIDEWRASYATVLTPQALELCELLGDRPHALPSLAGLMHSAAKLPPDRLHRLYNMFGSRLIEVWGMVENSGGPVTATAVSDYAEATVSSPIFRSVGRPLSGCEVRVVDDAGHDISEPDVVGELYVRSPALMHGYWEDEAASSAALVDDWLHTGDLGSIGADGLIEIADRRSDMIVSGGMNVYPSEIERVLLAMPQIADAAVIGVDHVRWGSTPAAILVAAPGSRPDSRTVVERLREELASYKKPTRFLYVDRLPRNASNKIIRPELRQLYESERGRAEVYE